MHDLSPKKNLRITKDLTSQQDHARYLFSVPRLKPNRRCVLLIVLFMYIEFCI